eukprot:TRINITY_DN3802_c0_g1_i2.p1 TRINITY_DN3802_c0_g1~~TRINITY_DN3802_c0_g1_i2.p1  ORF type:complete len:252 (-),score=76.52 TRINITY_DN3802_c0_g1_i2:12-767(-)
MCIRDSFSIIYPLDGSADSSGRFPCGRYANLYETKTIIFPEQMSCEKCTIQLMWESDTTKYYACSDITLMSDTIIPCIGKCQNGGACMNGKCACSENYYAKHCESKIVVEVERGNFWTVVILLLIVIIGLLVAAYVLNKKQEAAHVPFVEEAKEEYPPQVDEEAKEEEKKSVPEPEPKEENNCPDGHPLSLSSDSTGYPGGYYKCALCKKVLPCSETRWNCTQCTYDVCTCLLYTSPSPRDQRGSRMPSSA